MLPKIIHQGAALVWRASLASAFRAGSRASQIHPHLSGGVSLLHSRQAHTITNVDFDEKSRFLHLKFKDEHGAALQYPASFLRDNCRCAKCYDSGVKARYLLLADLDANISVAQTQVSPDGSQVAVTWSDGHKSSFGADWLQKRRLDETGRWRRREMYGEKKEYWDGTFAIPTIPYDECQTNAGLLKWITALDKFGLIVITNSPREERVIPELQTAVGHALRTNYGTSFTVKAKPDPNNLAYTPARLGLHIDLPFYTQPPGVQMLHCIKQAGGAVGGENEFVDAFHCADRMKSEYPDFYKLLTETHVDFWDIGKEAYEFFLTHQQRTITLNYRGEYEQVHFNNQVRDSYWDLPADQVQSMYEALKKFNEMFYDARNMVKYRLQDGDLVAFDNTRVMHGRAAYKSSPQSERHLEGGYLCWDDVRSRARVLKEKLNAWRFPQKND